MFRGLRPKSRGENGKSYWVLRLADFLSNANFAPQFLFSNSWPEKEVTTASDSDSLQLLHVAIGETMRVEQGRSQDLVSGGGTHFGGRGARAPIFRLRPQITRVPPLMYLWLPPDFGGGGRPPGYALGVEW